MDKVIENEGREEGTTGARQENERGREEKEERGQGRGKAVNAENTDTRGEKRRKQENRRGREG